MIVEFDIQTRRVLRVTGGQRTWRLDGQCLRCGKCCERGKCQALIMEMVDDKPRARCEAQWSKPWQCMLWPNDPAEPLPDGCGYRWTEE